MPRKLLVIGYLWPEPQTTAAGQRMVQLLHAFKELGYNITFATTASRTEHSLDLETMGITSVPIQLNSSSFDDFIKKLNPNLVIFDRFMVEEQFGWRVAEQIPNAVRILNTEDLHSLRKTRALCHKTGEEFTLEHWKSADITKREMASIYRCDLSLLISTYEMELLTKSLMIPEQILMHLPFMLNKANSKENGRPTFEERKDFITYGNGKHAPNVEAMIYLRNTIWPLVRKELPEATLKMYGAYLPQQVQEMHQPSKGIQILGWVDDLDAVVQSARVCLAPLRFGAGIKGKLVQAMQNGTPSVTTPIGAEGIPYDGHWPGEVCQNSMDFAKACVQLYSNQKDWQDASQRGLELIQKKFQKKYWHSKLASRLELLSINLKTHRSDNFIGSLLRHHTIASTKYMGKWIEEKNRG